MAGKVVRCLTTDEHGKVYECWITPDGVEGFWEFAEDASYRPHGVIYADIPEVKRASPADMAQRFVSELVRGTAWKNTRRLRYRV
ncbi:MAG: hypothetical protein HYW25_04675 [Candidatus Aenigmarchaeota archaeon]|nr:hypothetical protein [Candidatus Aenigmarchaeota archaeon]